MPYPALVPDPALVIGLISGTSADGVDAALCRVGSTGDGGGVRAELLRAGTFPYPSALRERVLEPDGLNTAALASLNVELGEAFASAALELCLAADCPLERVDLIGSHGQTVWHDPRGEHGPGRATLQLAEPAVIAVRTGRDVVADFRPADVALGGEGAPLVPYADLLLLERPGEPRAVLNLGGIANVTWLPGTANPADVLAFDTGPGNMLLDGLVRRLGLAPEGYDLDGRLAREGRVHEGLLEELLQEPFFSLPPPRSTGRELFGAPAVERLERRGAALGLNGRDLLATAAMLTCRSVADSLVRFCGVPSDLLLCGGGRRNLALREGLQRLLPRTLVRDTDEEGLDGDAKEAIAFAVLAFLAARGSCNHLPHVTGARGATVLGKFVWGSAP